MLPTKFPMLKPRQCELGKIKIGGKGEERTTQDGRKWRLPEKYDHFVITTMNREPNGDLTPDDALMSQLISEYGDKDGELRQLPITVLSHDIGEIMQCSWIWYAGKNLGAKSDGYTIEWRYSPTTFQALKEPRVEPWKDSYAELKDGKGNKIFKIHTTFNCVIAANESRWGGVYKLRTTSRITADQLLGSLVTLTSMTGGVLCGLPLMLVVRPVQVAPDGKPTTVYVIHCELRAKNIEDIQTKALHLAKFQLENKKQLESVQAEYRRMLVNPGDEFESEAADIAEEFAPEVPVGGAAGAPGTAMVPANGTPAAPPSGRQNLRKPATPPAEKTPALKAADEPRTDETQLSKITDLVQQLGLTPEAVQGIVTKAGASRLQKMTPEQTEVVIGQLTVIVESQAPPDGQGNDEDDMARQDLVSDLDDRILAAAHPGDLTPIEADIERHKAWLGDFHAGFASKVAAKRQALTPHPANVGAKNGVGRKPAF